MISLLKFTKVFQNKIKENADYNYNFTYELDENKNVSKLAKARIANFYIDYIASPEKKKRIYIATFLLNLSQLIIYFLNNDLTTALIYIVIVIRSFIYIYKDKFKTNIIPYVAILIQLIIGYFTIENALQILSVLIPCYSCWYLWFYKDTQKLRIGKY